jgi:hypothetical protein
MIEPTLPLVCDDAASCVRWQSDKFLKFTKISIDGIVSLFNGPNFREGYTDLSDVEELKREFEQSGS